MDDLKHLAHTFETILGNWKHGDIIRHAPINSSNDMRRYGTADDIHRALDIANRILDGRAVK